MEQYQLKFMIKDDQRISQSYHKPIKSQALIEYHCYQHNAAIANFNNALQHASKTFTIIK